MKQQRMRGATGASAHVCNGVRVRGACSVENDNDDVATQQQEPSLPLSRSDLSVVKLPALVREGPTRVVARCVYEHASVVGTHSLEVCACVQWTFLCKA